MRERNVTFKVDANGKVTPSIPQYGGIKGEHCATTLTFGFLRAHAGDTEEVFYEEGQILRLIFSLGVGAVGSSDMLQDTLTVDNMTPTLTYSLPRTVTVPSGQLSVRLAVSELDHETGQEVQLCQSAEAVLYFDDAAVENGTPFWRGVSEMLAGTVAACETTRELRDDTQALCEKATADMETIREEAIAEMTAIREQAVADVAEIRDETSAIREQAIADVDAIRAQAVEDTSAICLETALVRDQTAVIRNETAAIRSETEAMLKANDLLRYCGTVTGPTLMGIDDAQIGDVYTVSEDGKMYMWTGQRWYRLSNQLITVGDGTLMIS